VEIVFVPSTDSAPQHRTFILGVHFLPVGRESHRNVHPGAVYVLRVPSRLLAGSHLPFRHRGHSMPVEVSSLKVKALFFRLIP
jgi:hypothetical protein